MSTSGHASIQNDALTVSKRDNQTAVPCHKLDDPRILIIDDTRSIHEDFRKILATVEKTELDDVETELFASPALQTPRTRFILDFAYQGNEGLALVQESLAKGSRYTLAFVDVRMPPGWDGIETAAKLWAADPELQIVICTAYSDYSWEEMLRSFGQTDNLLILKKPFDAAEVMQIAHAMTRKWCLVQQAKWRLVDLDRTIAQRTQALQVANDKLLREIAERKQAEEKLRASENRYRLLFNSSTDAIFVHEGVGGDGLPGRFIEVNDAACQRLGYPREELLQMSPPDIDAPETLAAVPGMMAKLAAHKSAVWEGIHVAKSGQRIPVEISNCLFELNGKAVHLATVRDIAERKRAEQLEQQLRQSQKMEAVGQLAGGVAHDFNNLLAVIRGNTELVLMDENQLTRKSADCLKQVVGAADRAANLIRQLLAFSRKQVMQSQPLNLNDVIGNFTKMLKRIIGEDVQLQCNYAARPPFVRADVGMLEQVLVNLVVNARDAMPKGGQLLISTQNTSLDEVCAKACPEARAGEFVLLSVSDTGCGIGPEHLRHIFEPFFTTKEVGKGTGLGLATVYGIIKQHQGWIEVHSQAGAGSTFRIFLPAIAPPPAALVPEPVEAKPVGGTETILLVEDDEAVRSLTCRLLESFGYQVREAASGPQALKVWDTHSKEIELLLTDMVMPDGLSGRELADRLLAQRPGLKVIFMTGYSDELAGKDTTYLRQTGSVFLQKPCHWRDLLQAIRECLDEKSGAITGAG